MKNSIILLSIFGVIAFSMVIGVPLQFQKRSISDNEENVNCKDLSICDSVTQQMCTALPSLRANCPIKCQVEECLFTCEDTPECPEDVLPEVCGLLSDDDKHKCNQTCGLCEVVTIQAYVVIEKGSDCRDEGLQYIAEKDCKQAAEQRGLDFNTETDKDYPAGCYKHSNSVYFNRAGIHNRRSVSGGYYQGTTEYRSAPICR